MSEPSAAGGVGGKLPAVYNDGLPARCQVAVDTARLSPTLGVNEGKSKSYTSPHASICACVFVTPS